MPFIKSLFCLRGFDNRSRFFAICSATYVIFVMLSSAFTNNTLISLVLLVLFSLILGLTSLRRLHDAKLNKKWLFAPSLTFALVALIIIFSRQNSSYYLLIIPAFCSAILLTYSTRTQRNFILGYYGPVDMNEYRQDTHLNKQAKYRIEPTLINDNSDISSHKEDIEPNEQVFQSTNQTEKHHYSQKISSANNKTDIGELIRLKLIHNRKAQLIIAAIIGLIFITFTTSWLINYLNSVDNVPITTDDNQLETNIALSMTKNHPLNMPDNYTLYLSEHQGISINWQADEVNQSLLWSQFTAQGDESCKEISFNKGEPIRTLTVQVEPLAGTNIDYFANFSPLDSKALIKALAFSGNFTLCGYNFSLKGSQAALGSKKEYAQWVDY